MRAVKMQSAASNDSPFLLDDHKVANVFANLWQGSRQQRSVAGVARNQIMDLCRIAE
jgi:hypothetical protein